jgi:hypothetical protein
MKKIGFGVAVAVVLASAGAAQAEDLRVHRVFGDAGLGSPDSAMVAETAAVEKDCAFNVMSRRGPDPEDVAVCEVAAAKLMKRGAAAAPAILASLDKPSVGYHAKQRLYEVLAQTHDTRMVEPLLRAMARIASGRIDVREPEIRMIDRALAELTRAPVTDEIPWLRGTAHSDHYRAIQRTFDWRLWHEDHRGVSHQKLAADRLADARAHADDANTARAFGAVGYLLHYEPTEGYGAAQALLDRGDVPDEGKRMLEYQMAEATQAMSSAEVEALPLPKSVAPAAPPAPPSELSPGKSKPPPPPPPQQQQPKAPKKPGRVGA